MISVILVIYAIKSMLAILRPILFAFIKSKAIKKLVLDILKALAKQSSNKIDDQLVTIIEEKLLI